jgi:antitoxin HigA-1
MTIERHDLDAGRIDFSDIAEPSAPTLAPVHPGEILQSEWLAPLGLSAYRLAKDINVALQQGDRDHQWQPLHNC